MKKYRAAVIYDNTHKILILNYYNDKDTKFNHPGDAFHLAHVFAHNSQDPCTPAVIPEEVYETLKKERTVIHGNGDNLF